MSIKNPLTPAGIEPATFRFAIVLLLWLIMIIHMGRHYILAPVVGPVLRLSKNGKWLVYCICCLFFMPKEIS